MEQDACKQCRCTGIVPVPRGLYSIDVAVACSCGAGNARWSAVLEIIDNVHEEDRQARIDEANRQLRSRFDQHKPSPSKGAADTVRTLNTGRGGNTNELRIKIWRSKK
jgi:hypothetical protein